MHPGTGTEREFLETARLEGLEEIVSMYVGMYVGIMD